jgi:hypothetical protein
MTPPRDVAPSERGRECRHRRYTVTFSNDPNTPDAVLVKWCPDCGALKPRFNHRWRLPKATP